MDVVWHTCTVVGAIVIISFILVMCMFIYVNVKQSYKDKKTQIPVTESAIEGTSLKP